MGKKNMSTEQRIQHNKKELLNALQETLGVVTSACRICNLDRSTFYRYYNEDPEFARKADDVSEIAVDFAESKLHNQIKNDNTTAIIFYLKTKGKHRGYVERADNTYVQVNNNSNNQQGLDVKQLSDNQLKQLVDIIEGDSADSNEIMIVEEEQSNGSAKHHLPKKPNDE